MVLSARHTTNEDAWSLTKFVVVRVRPVRKRFEPEKLISLYPFTAPATKVGLCAPVSLMSKAAIPAEFVIASMLAPVVETPKSVRYHILSEVLPLF